MSSQEFERQPVVPERLEPARHFAASYAGEHVAGTEFVIGAMFVAWGVGTADILLGLLLGNLLAVLTWALVCAPIAVDTRLTLYAYLEKIAGAGTVKLYSLVNGVLFCILAGAMITVSASAVRILFDLPAQVHWYPTSAGFVAVALAVGAVVVAIAIKGFRQVAQFAEVCAPWMILMFFAGALVLLPSLVAATPGVDSLSSFSDFKTVADTYIWIASDSELGLWHVAAFAWICNLAMHGGLSDMTILRFARRYEYGYFSALGMFIGHFLAWICAGIMGAGAALLLKTTVTQLDAGAVAFEALGAAGIIAVIIAGWTTSNPTIYRAGLAFQSINPRWHRVAVTALAGTVTTIIACFPFVFSGLMDFVGLMGLILSPVGAIIVAEHWLFPRIGLTRYWAHYQGVSTNKAAVIAWVASLIAALILHRIGVHLYFLLVPTWLLATAFYVALAIAMGARDTFEAQASVDFAQELARQKLEREYLGRATQESASADLNPKVRLWRAAAIVSLGFCLLLSVAVFIGMMSFDAFKSLLIWPTIVYFVSAIGWVRSRERSEVITEVSTHAG